MLCDAPIWNWEFHDYRIKPKEKVRLYKWAIKVNGKWSETVVFYENSTELIKDYSGVEIEKYQMLALFIEDEQ